MRHLILCAGVGAMAAAASAGVSVSNYDDLAESFYGTEFAYNGVTYRDVNTQAGVFPDGGTFEPADLGDQVIVENATLLFTDFPGWGSPNNVLTFGSSYVNGPNLSLGAMSTVTMDLDQPASSASIETVFYENGPWGGIVFHLDALSNGLVVASDSFTLSNLGGRDNIAFREMSVAAPSFDQLHLYATFGNDYSGPRMMIDNLTLNPVPAPGVGAVAGLAGLALARRRRSA
jgi:hypothetical protein